MAANSSGSSGSDRRDRHHSLNHRRHQQLLRDHIHHNLHNSHHQNNNNTNPSLVNTDSNTNRGTTSSAATAAVIDIDAAINRLSLGTSSRPQDNNQSIKQLMAAAVTTTAANTGTAAAAGPLPLPTLPSLVASGGTADSALLCRFHMRGSCRDGQRCRFSHDTDLSVPIPETVCWYYLYGHCMFGESCRFVHLDAAGILANHYHQYEAHPPATAAAPAITTTNTGGHHYPSALPMSQTINSSGGGGTGGGPTANTTTTNTTSTITTTTTSPKSDSRQSSEDSGYAEPSLPTTKTTSKLGQTAANTGRTYAQMAHTVSTASTGGAPTPQPPSVRSGGGTTSGQLCPYAAQSIEGLCPYPEGQCHYTHGVMCELCGHHCLHPDDRAQQARHRDECVREHEREMELSFAVQRSLDKACGICMDIVFEKEPATERRFGILQSCSHIFCLSCIRKWRQTKQFENRTIRACPECRVPSDFVIPSKYWYDDRSEKDSLIESYKQALSTKPCKYFQQGRGECPFAGACFYLHAGPDGRRVEMPPPRQQRRRANQEGELETLRDMLLWNYLEVRDDNHWLLTLDLEDVFDIQEMGLLSGYDTDDDDEEDDDSDISDFNSADVIG